jgi:hypothetical protein
VSIKNSVDRKDNKVPSIVNTKILSITIFQNSVDHEDQKSSVDRDYKKFRRLQVRKFPLNAKLAGRGKYRNPFFIFQAKSKFEFALSF